MSFLEETYSSIKAALGLAKFNASAVNEFNLTVRGFWRSFSAILIGAPFAISIAYASPLNADIEISIPLWVFSYLLSWIIFPIVMVIFTKLFDLSGKYIQFIVALNWSSLVEIFLYFVLTLLSVLGLSVNDLFLFINFIGFIYILSYQIFVIRAALGGGWLITIGVLSLQLIVEFMILSGTTLL